MNGTMIEYEDNADDLSVKTNSPEPSQRLRVAAAFAGDEDYRNPDESDTDMSEAIGEVTPHFDFDTLLKFPPLPCNVDPTDEGRKLVVNRQPPQPLPQIPVNISLQPDTPHISWITRRAKRMANDEAEELFPGTIAARTNKKIRRRIESLQAKPKRKYEWRTDSKNKRKTSDDTSKAIENGTPTQADGQLNSNRKRVREDSDEVETPVRSGGRKRRQLDDSDDDSY